jgi:hypothetical protein
MPLNANSYLFSCLTYVDSSPVEIIERVYPATSVADPLIRAFDRAIKEFFNQRYLAADVGNEMIAATARH